jgi:glycosyltransferase involved in cell wall biosynthesis
MRLSFVLPSVIQTGGVRVIVTFAGKLAARGHEVTVLYGDGDPATFEPPGPVRFRQLGGPWHPLRRTAHDVWGKALYGFGYPLGRYLCSIAPDVRDATRGADLVVATEYRSVLPAMASDRARVLHHPQHDERLFARNRFEQKLTRDAMSAPVHRVVNSSWLRDRLAGERNVDYPLVTPAIDHAVFRVPEGPPAAAEPPQVFAYFSRRVWKGSYDLVDAFTLVRREVPEATLRFYGERPGEDVLSRPGVAYVGRPTDGELCEHYARATVTVSPSWYESYPLPPIEAMASGGAVVTTGPGVEDYAVDGENCLVVEPRDPRAMAGAIIKVIRDGALRDRLRAAAPGSVQSETWDNATDRYERVLQSFVKGGPG